MLDIWADKNSYELLSVFERWVCVYLEEEHYTYKCDEITTHVRY